MHKDWSPLPKEVRNKLSKAFLTLSPDHHAAKIRTSGGWYDAPKGPRQYTEFEYRLIIAAQYGVADPNILVLDDYHKANFAA